jgi:hypothetical protein
MLNYSSTCTIESTILIYNTPAPCMEVAHVISYYADFGRHHLCTLTMCLHAIQSHNRDSIYSLLLPPKLFMSRVTDIGLFNENERLLSLNENRRECI